MNRRHFIASLATGALAAPLLAENLTVTLPKPQSAKTSAKQDGVDFDALLWAIAEKETGHRDDVVGPCGSRSKYQISEAVWRQHGMHKKAWEPGSHTSSMKPYALRFDADCWGWLAKDLAQHHLRWLDANLPRRSTVEREWREYALAWCWNGGLSSWNGIGGTTPSSVSLNTYVRAVSLNAYACAVVNLYTDRIRS